MVERIDKIIASSGDYSRRDAHTLIRRGKVAVNGVVVRKNDFKCDAERDEVTLDGRTLSYMKNVYIMMNKPQGVLSASNDRSRKTVVDLAEEQLGRKGLFPVGRLDKDTTGLLLITDDGDFAHRIISPKSRLDKVYIATLDGRVTNDMIEKFAEGITLSDGYECMPARLEICSEDSFTARVTVREGKYHQIKRMFGVCGLGVNALHRQSIGILELDKNLQPGECRLLDEKEILAAQGKEDV